MTPPKNAKNGSSTKMLELFIRELVKNTVREEVEKMLPVLAESIAKSGRPLTESVAAPREAKPMTDRSSIVNLMKSHFTLEGDTIKPTNSGPPMTFNASITGGANVEADMPDFMQKVLNRDYTELVKKIT